MRFETPPGESSPSDDRDKRPNETAPAEQQPAPLLTPPAPTTHSIEFTDDDIIIDGESSKMTHEEYEAMIAEGKAIEASGIIPKGQPIPMNRQYLRIKAEGRLGELHLPENHPLNTEGINDAEDNTGSK